MEFFLVSGGISQGTQNTVQGHENMVIPGNSGLALKFVVDNCETQCPLDDSEEIIKNFCAVPLEIHTTSALVFEVLLPTTECDYHHLKIVLWRFTLTTHHVSLSHN